MPKINYYTAEYSINTTHPKDSKKNFLNSTITVRNCSNDFRSNITHHVNCPLQLLMILLQMMGLTTIVKIEQIDHTKTSICVTESHYLCGHIMEVIKTSISNSYYPNLSKLDAEAIIAKLNLSSYVYCVESNKIGCLVVLHQGTYHKQPYKIFQEDVYDFNLSRTVVITPAQRDMFLSDEQKSSIEFCSVLPGGKIQLVFKRGEIDCVPVIKQKLLIENMKAELLKEEEKLKKMEELNEMMELQKQMFPWTEPKP